MKINQYSAYEDVADKVAFCYAKYLNEPFTSYDRSSFISELVNRGDYVCYVADLPYNEETADIYDYIIDMMIEHTDCPRKYIDAVMDKKITVENLINMFAEDEIFDEAWRRDLDEARAWERKYETKLEAVNFFFDTMFGDLENLENVKE